MEITIENQQVIKVLNALIGGRIQRNLEKFPVVILQEEAFNFEKIGIIEGLEILQYLKEQKYIEILTESEYEKFEKDFEKSMNWVIRFLRKRRNVPKDKIELAMKKLLWKFGFDTDSKNFNETEKFEDLNDWEKKVSSTVYEKYIKSPLIEKYKITKNLFELREKLRKGRDFYNMSDDFITYNAQTFDLYIGEEYINIRPQEDIPAGHFILEFILKNDPKKTYNIDELIKMEIIPSQYHMKKALQYATAARGITRKINKQTNTKIPDFFNVSKGTIKIREKYTL